LIQIMSAPHPADKVASSARMKEPAMPYASNEDLPPPIRAHLPAHAQDIYRGAFNSAWENYRNRGPKAREEIAHRVAWAAVKRRYRKEGDHWVAIAP
jgi:cation transport regulator